MFLRIRDIGRRLVASVPEPSTWAIMILLRRFWPACLSAEKRRFARSLTTALSALQRGHLRAVFLFVKFPN
jgi:hypothetical protein